jgi:hypothetical protein
MITIQNNQVIKFQTCNVRLDTNKVGFTNIFGSVNNELVKDINLFVANCIFQGPDESDTNIFVISNLWSRNNFIDAITIRGCELDRVRFMKYDKPPPPPVNIVDRLVQNIIIQACTCLESSNELFLFYIGGNAKYNIIISDCYYISNDSESVFTLLRAPEIVQSTNNEFLLSLTSVHFRNIYNQNNDPFIPWFKSANILFTMGKFNIKYSDATIENYDSLTSDGMNPSLKQYFTIS